MKSPDYNYRLPEELIAHAPAEPRDSARLLIYSTKTNEIFIDTFAHIARYIPSRALMVFNDTQVVPARLELMKLTGGTVRILFLVNEWRTGVRADGGRDELIKGLPDRKLTVGDQLYFNHHAIMEVVGQHNEEFSFKLRISDEEFEKLCALHGRTPLPPYIHTTLNEEQARTKYQTVFAAKPSSVAAPTASLHFTDRVLTSLAEKGIDRTMVTLHVGRGTFASLTPESIQSKSLHSEPIQVSAESANRILEAKKEGKIIVSSGTTATRTLEATSDYILKGEGYTGETTLMIMPPFDFKIVDAIITNFHLPNTSLIMLVDAFLQAKGAKATWRDLYERAIKEKFRFYSFGDAMLII
ncbi:MAG TPA: tRNA preQ1(34) S-adenosylmethionine ribosyltransferase-isomerase QueA [Candidatus Paceibacterota bacterium]|jgi:S-adenosylmethionine:tRNA ribosyltransferase-isomerase|nr:tRNA preQ1(34) S-adenosylmethionine ribosyltransferase-isomerase QueA [Candidatus Paceibacterota bacterium]